MSKLLCMFKREMIHDEIASRVRNQFKGRRRRGYQVIREREGTSQTPL